MPTALDITMGIFRRWGRGRRLIWVTGKIQNIPSNIRFPIQWSEIGRSERKCRLRRNQRCSSVSEKRKARQNYADSGRMALARSWKSSVAGGNEHLGFSAINQRLVGNTFAPGGTQPRLQGLNPANAVVLAASFRLDTKDAPSLDCLYGIR